MKRKVLSVLLCAGLVVSMMAGCGSKEDSGQGSEATDMEYVKDKGTLVVGITNFEPMDYKDESGEWIGFDADLAKAFAEQGYSYQVPFYFPSIGEYASLLEQAGFEVRYAVLFDRMTELMGEDGMKDWIRMFISTPFYAVSEEAQREAIRNRAVELLKKDLYRDGKWYADYVRLRMRAIKGGRK